VKKTTSPLTVGKPDVRPSLPSHVPGVREGNQPGSLKRSDGIVDHGTHAVATGRRSTGLNAREREPIDPRMPKLTPP